MADYNIRDVEKLTGISKQNIRYYEKQGLLHPKRNPENLYREYSGEDVELLLRIKLFRKLDMPLEDIRSLLEGERPLQTAVKAQKERLRREQERLKDALEFCDEIKEQSLEGLNAEIYLEKMEQREKSGAVFADFLRDFKKVAESEAKQRFSFRPDTMCMTKEEFTEALFAYADENHRNLVITKESMYPEFLLDGVAYRAERVLGRFGAVVYCEMLQPGEALPQDIPKKRYRKLKFLFALIPPAALLLYAVIVSGGREITLPVMLVIFVSFCLPVLVFYFYYHFRD